VSKTADLTKIFYPYQKAFIAETARFVLWIASRQIGKSFGLAAKCVGYAMKKENAILISTNQRNAQRLITTCKKIIKIFEIASKQKIALVRDNASTIEIKGGGTIQSIANNPDTAVGESGHLFIDEASRFKNSEQILDAVMPFITRNNYSMTLISTPLGKRGMFWDFYNKALNNEGGWKLHKHTVYDAIEQGCPINVEDIRANMDEISFRQNYLCEFIDDISSYFSYDLILSVINHELYDHDITELKKKDKTPKIAGYDPGKIIDSGVFTVIDRDIISQKVRLLHIKEFLRIDYSEQISYIVTVIKSAGIAKLYVDATGVGVKIAEDLKRELGSVVVPITYTNAVKESLITELKLRMERREIEIPDHSKLIDQLHRIERTTTASGLARYQHQVGQHDDIVFSLCNAVSGFSLGARSGIRSFSIKDFFLNRTRCTDFI